MTDELKEAVVVPHQDECEKCRDLPVGSYRCGRCLTLMHLETARQRDQLRAELANKEKLYSCERAKWSAEVERLKAQFTTDVSIENAFKELYAIGKEYSVPEYVMRDWKVKWLEAHLRFHNKKEDDLKARISTLVDDHTRLRDALEFYADPESWFGFKDDDDLHCRKAIHINDLERRPEDSAYIGGVRARKALSSTTPTPGKRRELELKVIEAAREWCDDNGYVIHDKSGHYIARALAALEKGEGGKDE